MSDINQVDVSAETVEREWARIASEHKALDTTSEPEALAPVDSGLDFEGVDGVDVLNAEQPESSTMEEKVAMAEMAIKSGLLFVFDAIGGLDIPEDKYARMANAWAVVIAKHFEGGIFEFLAKYREEIAALGATFVFVGAVKAGAKVKREALAAEKVIDKKAGLEDVKSS
jgi:uncharacterized glyoxalase superfamily protein PhnB